MVSLTFHGSPRSNPAKNPHIIRWNIYIPLIILGILSLFAGAINMAPLEELFGSNFSYLHHWLNMAPSTLTAHHYHELIESFSGYHSAHISSILPALISLTLAISGMALAWKIYESPNPTESGAVYANKLNKLYTVLMHDYYLNDYQLKITKLTRDRIASTADIFDRMYVDGVVNRISLTSLSIGKSMSKLQTGIVTNYAFLISLGLLFMLLILVLWSGWL
jgi:NADH-quinone oxidoreductase subunit L